MAAAPSESKDERDRCSIFVRGIDFKVTSGELEELCGEVGPVRRCILVHGKGESSHRGYGFVQFALADDAQRAAQALDGQKLGARNLKVEMALKRKALQEGHLRKRLHEEMSSDPQGKVAGEGADTDADADGEIAGETQVVTQTSPAGTAIPKRAKTKAERTSEAITKAARTMFLGMPRPMESQE